MKKYYWLWIVLAVLVLGVGIELVVWMNFQRPTTGSNETVNTNLVVTNSSLNLNAGLNANSAEEVSAGQLTLIASMQGFQSGLGFRGNQGLESLVKQSWVSLLDSSSFATYFSNLKTAQAESVALMKDAPFSANRDVVGEFTWNVIEPREGEFDWTLSDAAMQAAGQAGVTVSAVVQPFSSWGSAETVPSEKCVGIDFAFMDYKGGLPVDIGKYQNFLTALVERYDGDGLNDMAGLSTRVSAWEVGNEYEGPCSGSLNEAENYLTLLKASHATIKQADASALVLNAGSLEIIGGNGLEITDTINFWNTFFELGGAEYLDIFNIHYNRERSEQQSDLTIWQKHLDFFRNLLDTSGHGDMPMWMTEYGTFGGTIQSHPRPDGQAGATLSRTDDEQASWYFRTMITGMAAGMQRFFFDLQGNDSSGIGSSSWFHSNGQPREFTKTVTATAVALQGATSVEKLAEGQYKFETQDSTVYALWDGVLPTDISGTVTVMALDGVTASQSASSTIFSEAAPVLVTIHAPR